MHVDLDEYQASFMVDGALILFKDQPSIYVIEKIERLLQEVANDAIRKSLEEQL